VAPTIGTPTAIPAWLSTDGPLPRRLATLAPLVLDAAESGDPVSAQIVAEGVGLLVASAVAASSSSHDVALHGGLTEHVWFRAALDQALRAAGRAVVVSVGDALDGALLLAERTDLPHERFVHRAE
jgi:N-acetylglucosamine kinase-like BadF-type ATPase